jgi:pyruvate,orthophosphate dikinase
MFVDEENKFFVINDVRFNEGDYISLDGNTGTVYEGKLDTVEVGLTGDFATLLQWADEVRTLGIRTNADTPKDAETAVRFGAEGIGLCRTEHMFFSDDRILKVRKMILSTTIEERRDALQFLMPFQREDFIGIFREMGERPVTIRLLDPPLHEFLPHKEDDMKRLAKDLDMSYAIVKHKIENLMEVNPMLGHRGCRLAITYPEIYEMQVEAITEAAIHCIKNENIKVKPEIMIPLVGHMAEFTILKTLTKKTVEAVMARENTTFEYKIGTMIEVPRAALIADQIAEEAEFFSFGTNDLTQMTLGFSRDDAGKFLGEYMKKGVFEKDPFETIDQEGVGKLIHMGVELGRKTNADLKVGICGEHGGETKSIAFCHKEGLNYVSCSPYRVPIARLAAAHAALNSK